MRFENVSDEEFDLQLHMPKFGMITGGTNVLSCDIGILEELQLDESERDAKKKRANGQKSADGSHGNAHDLEASKVMVQLNMNSSL